jgi:hypothetical protein
MFRPPLRTDSKSERSSIDLGILDNGSGASGVIGAIFKFV